MANWHCIRKSRRPSRKSTQGTIAELKFWFLFHTLNSGRGIFFTSYYIMWEMKTKHLYLLHIQSITTRLIPQLSWKFFLSGYMMRNRGVIPGLDRPSEEVASKTLSVGIAGTDCRARRQETQLLSKSHSPMKQFLSTLSHFYIIQKKIALTLLEATVLV